MKKLLLALLFSLICSSAQAATTWYACSGGGNWNGASTWTSIIGDEVGCTGALGNPVAGDTAILNASSGYASTLAIGSQTLAVTSNVTLGGTITASTGTLQETGSTTLTFTSNGITWPGKFNVTSGTPTITLVGNWINTGLVTISSATVINWTTNETFTTNGGLTSNSAISGTATLILGGGTWSGSSVNAVSNNLTFAGNVSLSGAIAYNTGTITYSSGTITVPTTSILYVTGGLGTSLTLNTKGMTWGGFYFQNGVNILNLTSDLSCNSIAFNFYAGTTTFTVSGGGNIFSKYFNWSYGNGNTKVTLSLSSGMSLNVSQSLSLMGFTFFTSAPVLYYFPIISGTPGSPAYINYTGSPNNATIVLATFTDIYARQKLYDYGATQSQLIRTSNIVVKQPSNFNQWNGYQGL